MVNVFTKEEISFGSGGPVPEGALVECEILSVAIKDSQSTKGNKYLWVKYEVCRGAYEGVKFYDMIGIAGSDKFIQQGRQKLMYIAEFSRMAHTKEDKSGYNYNDNYADLVGLRAVIKVRVTVYQGNDGKWYYGNEAADYASPRSESSRFEMFSAYARGEQPWQKDQLPALPQQAANNGNNGSYGHEHQDVPLSAY